MPSARGELTPLDPPLLLLPPCCTLSRSLLLSPRSFVDADPLLNHAITRTTHDRSLVFQDKNKYNAKKYRLVARISNKYVSSLPSPLPTRAAVAMASGD
jgi:hypothetical protein